MGGIVAITNPNAKKNRKVTDRRKRLARALGDSGVVFETKIPEDVGPLMDEVLKIDPEIIAVCGGDGTMHLTLSALINAYKGTFPPKFVILRGGTMNVCATATMTFLPAEMMLRRVADKYRNGQPYSEVERKTLKMNDWHGFLFGLGTSSHLVWEYHKESMAGRTRALKVTAQAIGAVFNSKGELAKRLFKRLNGEVLVDDEPLPIREFLGVLGGTLRYVSIGFRPLYRAYESDEHFHLFASNISPLVALKNIRRLFLGRPLKADPKIHFDFLAKKLEVRPDGFTPLIIDGEIYQIDHLLVTMGPRIKIING